MFETLLLIELSNMKRSTLVKEHSVDKVVLTSGTSNHHFQFKRRLLVPDKMVLVQLTSACTYQYNNGSQRKICVDGRY